MTTPKPLCRVLVVSSGKQAYDYIAELLPSGEYDPITHVTSAGEAKRLLVGTDYDILIINTPLPDEFGTELALDCAVGTRGVLVLCKSELYEQVSYRLEDSGILTLPRPVTRQTFYTTVRLLAATNARLAKMEKQNRSLKEKMEDIRVINRAKWLLIEHLSMHEQEAHYYIEKQAMDMRLSRREVAEHIIRTYDQ